MGVSLQNREGTYDVSGSFQMQSLSKKGRSRGTPKTSKNRDGRGYEFQPTTSGHHQATVSAKRGGDEGYDDASDKYIIQKTTEYDIAYTDEGQRPRSGQRQSSDDPDDITPPFSYLRR